MNSNSGALRGCPPLEGVAEDRKAGWSEGEAFPLLFYAEFFVYGEV